MVVPEEPLAHEKLFPLLGMVRVPDARRGIDAARALLRIGGAGHSAVIHSHTPATILAYGAAVRVLRVTVNAPGSTGSAGLDTHLPLTMTDRHGVLRPLVADREPAARPSGAVDAGRLRLRPQRRRSATSPAWSRGRRSPPPTPVTAPVPARGRRLRRQRPTAGLSREELRRLILAELREVVRG